MIANTLGSNNNDETIPITSNPNRENMSLVRRITNLFRSRNHQHENIESEGYVEFGGMSNNSNSQTSGQQKTLGTFAGCFAPVSLSMFSALVFIRYDKLATTSN